MKEMKTINFNGQQYEIVDEKAREALSNLKSEENLNLFYSSLIKGIANPEHPLDIITYPEG
jgi:hypothetical protein